MVRRLRQVQVVLVCDDSTDGYDVALVSTDLTAPPGQVIEHYAARWPIEIAVEDTKQTTGVGRAPTGFAAPWNVPSRFGLLMSTLGDLLVRHRRLARPGRPRRPNTSPVLPRQGLPITRRHAHQLRRVIITANFSILTPTGPPEEINVLRLAWADIAA